MEPFANPSTHMNDDIKIIILLKKNPDERFVFTYRDENSHYLLPVFGRFAADPELRFTWYDAAILARKVQEGWNPSLIPSRF